MSAASVAVSSSNAYGVDPNQGEDDGTVFNFAPGNTTSTAAPITNAAANPTTATSTATAATGTDSGLSSLSGTTWLILGGVALLAIWLWRR